MKREEYLKNRENMENEARKIDEGLLYSVLDDGIYVKNWIDGSLLHEWDIEDVEYIIYHERINNKDIEDAKKSMQKIENFFNFSELDITTKMEEAYKLANLALDCIEADVMEDFGEGDEAFQYIVKNAEKWGMLYLWYNYIFLPAASIIEEYEKEENI